MKLVDVFIKEVAEELKIEVSLVSNVIHHFFNTIKEKGREQIVAFFWLPTFGKIYYRRFKKERKNNKE